MQGPVTLSPSKANTANTWLESYLQFSDVIQETSLEQWWHQFGRRANFHFVHPSPGVVSKTVRLEKLIWVEEGVRFDVAARWSLKRELHMWFEVRAESHVCYQAAWEMVLDVDCMERAGVEYQGSALLCPSEEQLLTDTVRLWEKFAMCPCLFLHLLFSVYGFFAQDFHLSKRLFACPAYRQLSLWVYLSVFLTHLLWNLTVSRLDGTDVFLLPWRSLKASLLPHQHLLSVNSKRAFTVKASWCSFSSIAGAWLFSCGRELASHSRLIVDHYVKKVQSKLCCLCLLICMLMTGLMCKVFVLCSRKCAQ